MFNRIKMFAFLSLFFIYLLPIDTQFKVILGFVAVFFGWMNHIKARNTIVFTYTYKPLFRLKVFKSNYDDKTKKKLLVHSKIYVIDGRYAFVGSVNFTHMGMMRNYESSVIIKDQSAVKQIDEEVERLFKSNITGHKDIIGWGKFIYPEPINSKDFLSHDRV